MTPVLLCHSACDVLISVPLKVVISLGNEIKTSRALLCYSARDVLILLSNEMTTIKGTGQMRHERNENDLLVGA